jgi:hypothetical protein
MLALRMLRKGAGHHRVIATCTSQGVLAPPETFLDFTAVQFRADAADQFGASTSSPPAAGWAVGGGGGIDATRLFTALGAGGGGFSAPEACSPLVRLL